MSGIVVTPETRVGQLLDAHPELEETLISVAPQFQALKNPVLRRTVAKVATLEQAARVADIPVNELVRRVREALGHGAGGAGADEAPREPGAAPGWIDDQPARVFDADVMLAEGSPPIGEISRALFGLATGETVLVRASFEPAPLIDALRGKGHEVFSRKGAGDSWEAWVRKR